MRGLDKSPQSLAARAIAGFPPVAENGTNTALTTGMTTDRKNFIFTPRRGIMAEIEYPGVAQLVGRDIWECVDPIHARLGQKPAKPCNTCVCGTFHDCRKRYKIGFDHINDHRQKIFDFLPRRGIMTEK